ncbi:MAG: SusE domain-containing protein [Bacteroidales bacterium]|nr:SusE domain-containing protein [Bacteroidales bacterium]
MKRYFWMMAAAVFGLVACQNELEEVRLVDPSQVVAPVLHELPSEIVITAENMSETVKFEWDKADFGQPVQYSYTLYGSTDGGQTLVKIYSNMTDTSIEVPYESFNQVVTTAAEKGGLGLVAGQATDVTFVVGATVGSNYQTFYSNPRTVSISPTEAERVYETVWLPGTANSWSHDTAQHLFCYAEDGNTYVGVTDFGEGYADNQFKVTGAAGWADETGNWGMADPSAPAESASITLKNGSQDNITIYRAHRYYHFTFTKDNLGLKMDKGFDKVGVIGLNGDWENDIVMTLSNNKQLFYVDIDVPSDTEFKFRLDGGWDTNWGGDMSGLTGGGDNIPVSAGQYRVYLNLNDWDHPTAKLSTSMYGQPEETEPETPPVVVTGWNIIGLNGDWDNDVLATGKDGVWTAYITANEATDFKWRKDGSWDENYGGVLEELGKPFAAVAGGDNIKVNAGFYKVVLNTNDLTITVSNGEVWSLIGDFNSWGGDVDMELVDGKWVSPETAITAGGLKIRHNHDWAENVGGTMAELGQPFAAVAGGDNIAIPADGTYIVTYDPSAQTITVVNAKKTWSVIGVNDDWNTDVAMTEVMPGIWVSDMITAEKGGWKVRFDKGWDVNRGGATPAKQGEFVKAVQGGDNIGLLGTFKVVYNANNETIGTLQWGVVGSIASINGFNWNGDVPMNLGADGKWYSIPVTLTTTDEIKVRENADWANNRGGDCAAANEAFAVTNGGNNFKAPADGTYMVVYDPAAETITLSTQFWGVIGDFNSWGGDVFMMYDGAGKWAAYNQTITGGWKIRQGCGWDVNRGGTYTAGAAFPAAAGGDNINVSDKETFSIIYDSVAETITIE